MWDFLFVFFAWDFCLRFLFGGCFAGCYLLAVGFSTYFSTFTPTLWVCPLIFLLPRPRRGFSRLFSYFHAQVNIFIKRNYEFSVIKSWIPFTKQHIYATLNTTRLSSLSASYFIQKICFTIQIFTHPHRLHFTVLSDNSTCFRIKPAI